MKFCTAINCMDGRVQIPVIRYLKDRFGVDFVDMVTEAGPNRVLADQDNKCLVESILFRIKVSVEKHGSKHIAIIGHYDCAGNPVEEELQKVHTEKSMKLISEIFKDVKVTGLWVNREWKVVEL